MLEMLGKSLLATKGKECIKTPLTFALGNMVRFIFYITTKMKLENLTR